MTWWWSVVRSHSRLPDERRGRSRQHRGALFFTAIGPQALRGMPGRLLLCPLSHCPMAASVTFDHPVTVDEVAGSIGAGLRKAALAARVNGKLVDTSYVIAEDAQLAIVTDKDPDGLEVIRHSTAHLLAQAVKELFPDAQVTIGPVIEDGFYYDFAFERPFTPEDLAAIEAKMTELAKEDQAVSRRVMPRDEAVKFFRSLGELYKAEIIAGIPDKDEISLYGQGRLGGPVPRPARALHGQAQGLQADQGCRRLLARGLAQRDAAADLRHRLGRQEAAGRLPAPAGGGREARPPPHRQGARPVSPAGRGAGGGLLAPQGLDRVPDPDQLHARAPGGGGLRGGERAGADGCAAVGAVRAPGEVRREHVSHQDPG